MAQRRFRFLTLGIPAIDAEHMILAGYIDALTILISYDDMTTSSTVEALIGYFHRHAADEEVLMLATQYDRHEAKAHKLEHTRVLAETRKALVKPALTMADLDAGVAILEMHIATFDKLIAKFLNDPLSEP